MLLSQSLTEECDNMANSDQWRDPTIIDNKIHEGYLYKKGKLNKSWKKRYFILSRDRKLKYFSTKPPSLNPKINNSKFTDSSNSKKSNETKGVKEIGFINLYLVTGVSTHQCDNTDEVYDLNNPNIKKNSRYYEEQDIFQQFNAKYHGTNGKKTSGPGKLKSKFTRTHNRASTFGGSNGKVLIEYIYKLYTPKRIWYLKCKDEQSMNIWTTKIKQVIIH